MPLTIAIKRFFKSLFKFIIPNTFYKYYFHLENLRLFLNNLSELRTPGHINHFKDIHRMALSQYWTERNLECLLLMTYYESLGDTNQRNELKSREFKLLAQNDEDGLLLYIFSKIGVKNRNFVDFGCGGSSNTANLVINFGWKGLFIDGDSKNIQKTIKFFNDRIGSEVRNLSIIERWITKENINQIIEKSGITGEIDLLSIDIDGNDYWIWEAIDVVYPSVVLIEYNASFGPERSLSVKYDQNFDVSKKHPSRWYHGASLSALTKLGRKKGYALIGCESHGVNAFFVRNDLIQGKFYEVTPKEAFYSHFQRSNKMSDNEQFDIIKDLEYIEV